MPTRVGIQPAGDGGSSCGPFGCIGASMPGKGTEAPGTFLAYPGESKAGRHYLRTLEDSRGWTSAPVDPCCHKACSSCLRPR